MPGTANETADQANVRLHRWSDEAFLRESRQDRSVPELTGNPELVELFLPLLRADRRSAKSYR